MKTMSSPPVEPADLIDLKLLPAWVKEPTEPKSYEHYTGEEGEGPRDGRRPPRDKRGGGNSPKTNFEQPTSKADKTLPSRLRKKTGRRERRPRGSKNRPPLSGQDRHVPV